MSGALIAPSFATAAPRDKQPAGATMPADVETVESLYAKLDYENATLVAERVLKQKGLSHDQLVRTYRVLAVTYAILDKEEQSRDAFVQLLVYDPEYQVDPNLGPKVNTPFVEARGVYRSLASKPGIEVAANVRSDGGTLRVTTRDPTRVVKKVVVGYRWTSSGEYKTQQVQAGDAVVEVAVAPTGRTRLDFYAQALDANDNAVLEAGNPSVPKSAFIEAAPTVAPPRKEESSGGILSSPVFWLVTGAVVVGGGTAAFFAFRPQDPPDRADLGPILFCGTNRCQ